MLQMPFGFHSTASDVLKGIDLRGRTMIVSGGASGIGTETMAALAAAGASVVIASQRASRVSFTRLNMPGVYPVTRLNTLLNAASDAYPVLWAISDIGAGDVRRSVEAQ